MGCTSSLLVMFGYACITAAPPADALPAIEVREDVLYATAPGQVRLEGFLGYRVDRNREGRLKTHMTEYRLLEGFRERPGRQTYTGEHAGKWLDAAVLAAEYVPGDQELREKIDRIAHGLMAQQLEDGYLGTYLKERRWTEWDVWVHKYNLIGLLSYYRLTGDPRALESCRRMADLLIRTFHDEGRDILKSGPHEGMASTSVLEPICYLYVLTGEERYRAFSEYLIRKADEGPKLLTNIEKYGTVHRVGNRKAYEMMSNYVGLIEYGRATGRPRGLKAAHLAWESILRENRFITGGIDAHEHFSPPHTLETTGRCTETCVQFSWLQMNLRLLRATGHARYADEIHRLVYNHLAAAQHPRGIEWCYFTTMEGEKSYEGVMTCCGSNGARAMALLPTVAYMAGKDRLVVNLYETSSFRAEVGGVQVALNQETDYPWDGRVRLVVEPERPVEFTLQLLIPYFAEQCSLAEAPDLELVPGQYASLHRTWDGKTALHLNMEMPVVAHERAGRWALARGPQILAFEEKLNEGLDATRVIPDISRLHECVCAPAPSGLSGWPQGRIMIVPGKTASTTAAGNARSIHLKYRPFSDAGSAGGNISVYLPRAEHVTRPSKEHYVFRPRIPGTTFKSSRSGEITGSFIDGDERSTTYTDNSEYREVDWFAAFYKEPITIDRIMFIHGRFLPGGGWWVTKKEGVSEIERPAIEILRTPESDWERIGVIRDYPETTAGDPGEVEPHSMFITTIDPVTVVAVRVVGVPSSGNEQSGNLVSCAELDVRVVGP